MKLLLAELHNGRFRHAEFFRYLPDCCHIKPSSLEPLRFRASGGEISPRPPLEHRRRGLPALLALVSLLARGRFSRFFHLQRIAKRASGSVLLRVVLRVAACCCVLLRVAGITEIINRFATRICVRVPLGRITIL